MGIGGVALELAGGGDLHIWAALGGLLADEAAIHAAYGNKGASGFRPCILCKNVVLARTTRPRQPADVPHTCWDVNAVQEHDAESLRRIAERLQHTATHGRVADLNDLQTESGWNFNAHAVLWSPHLFQHASPHLVVLFDWMHVVFVGGIFNVHMGQLVHHMRPLGMDSAHLCNYVAAFKWPASIGSKTGCDVFGPKRFQSSWDAWSLRATGSEGLSLVPVLANRFEMLLESCAEGPARAHAACFLLLAHIVEKLLASTRLATALHARDIWRAWAWHD